MTYIKNCGTRKGKGGCTWAGSAEGKTGINIVAAKGAKQYPSTRYEKAA